jgi:hypothetical protein
VSRTSPPPLALTSSVELKHAFQSARRLVYA